MEKLTASLEDYLEIIGNHSSSKRIRAIDISKQLNVSRASVSEALKKLAQKGYINHAKYNDIVLTELGLQKASDIRAKHSILQSFFENLLGLTKEEASENACKIEHVITDNAFKQISKYLEKHQNLWTSLKSPENFSTSQYWLQN